MVKRKEKKKGKRKKRKRRSYDEWLGKKKSKENQRTKQKRKSPVMREKRTVGEWADMDLSTHKT